MHGQHNIRKSEVNEQTNERTVDRPVELLLAFWMLLPAQTKANSNSTRESRSAVRLTVGFSDVYCQLQQISRFCVTSLSCNMWTHKAQSRSITGEVQGDQKVSVLLMITVQKTRKNILNSFNHLP
jgi:hypothetical protein